MQNEKETADTSEPIACAPRRFSFSIIHFTFFIDSSVYRCTAACSRASASMIRPIASCTSASVSVRSGDRNVSRSERL